MDSSNASLYAAIMHITLDHAEPLSLLPVSAARVPFALQAASSYTHLNVVFPCSGRHNTSS